MYPTVTTKLFLECMVRGSRAALAETKKVVDTIKPDAGKLCSVEALLWV